MHQHISFSLGLASDREFWHARSESTSVTLTFSWVPQDASWHLNGVNFFTLQPERHFNVPAEEMPAQIRDLLAALISLADPPHARMVRRYTRFFADKEDATPVERPTPTGVTETSDE